LYDKTGTFYSLLWALAGVQQCTPVSTAQLGGDLQQPAEVSLPLDVGE
jgi:hypothetical protein